MVGSTGSGKGSLLHKFAATVGATKDIDIRFYKDTIDGQPILFWEWVGTNNPRSPKPEFYTGARAACVVYDSRSIPSFEQAKAWIRVIQAEYNIHSVLLLANYCQDHNNRVILPQEMEFLASTKNLMYCEVDPATVAKVGENIELLVEKITIVASH